MSAFVAARIDEHGSIERLMQHKDEKADQHKKQASREVDFLTLGERVSQWNASTDESVSCRA